MFAVGNIVRPGAAFGFGEPAASPRLRRAKGRAPVTAARLLGALNEPNNWLMMNGDYGSIAYSKLTQINRATSGICGWSGPWRSAACRTSGQNGPESEMHPLVDNGFMYTSDGWGTLYKIDGRAVRTRGEFVWVTDPGVKHQGNVLAHARHRALGRPGDREHSRRPRDWREPQHRAKSCGTRWSRRRTTSASASASTRRRSPPTAR
jgi:glucose dehydrogenase